jgi:hypothetical protein
LTHAARGEAAIRQELLVLALALPLGLVAAPNAAWYAAMIGVLFVVLAVELLSIPFRDREACARLRAENARIREFRR